MAPNRGITLNDRLCAALRIAQEEVGKARKERRAADKIAREALQREAFWIDQTDAVVADLVRQLEAGEDVDEATLIAMTVGKGVATR